MRTGSNCQDLWISEAPKKWALPSDETQAGAGRAPSGCAYVRALPTFVEGHAGPPARELHASKVTFLQVNELRRLFGTLRLVATRRHGMPAP